MKIAETNACWVVLSDKGVCCIFELSKSCKSDKMVFVGLFVNRASGIQNGVVLMQFADTFTADRISNLSLVACLPRLRSCRSLLRLRTYT